MMMLANRPPWLLRYRSSKEWITCTIYFAIFTNYFLYGLLNPVLPYALNGHVGTAPSDAQKWTSILLSIYGGTLAVFAIFFGWISDHTFTRRAALLLDQVFIGSSTICFCIAMRIELLAIGRFFEGLSSATLYTASQALLVDTYEESKLGKANGWLGLVAFIGTLISPFIGGLIYDLSGYRATYSIIFVLIGLCLLLRLGMIEKKVAAKWLNADVSSAKNGQQQEQNTHEPFKKADDEPRHNFPNTQDSYLTISSAAAAALEEASTALNQSKLPVMIQMLRNPRFQVGFYVSIVRDVMITGLDSVIALFVQSTFGWNTAAAGLCFIPVSMPFVFGPLVGRLVDKVGTRWPAASGFVLATPSFICLRLVSSSTLGHKVLLFALLFLIGLSFTLVTISVMTEFAAALKEQEELNGLQRSAYGQAYGLFNTACGIGIVIGPLIGGFVRDHLGWNALMLILGCINAFTAGTVMLWYGSTHVK